jgi:hypothetical protein
MYFMLQFYIHIAGNSGQLMLPRAKGQAGEHSMFAIFVNKSAKTVS